MGLDPVALPTSQEIVVDALRRQVALGVYQPGERLPSERELADLLGVGRMTVREAVRELNEQGLLTTTRGRTGGTRVTEHPVRSSIRDATRESIAELRGNYEFRLAVEPFVATLAAQRAGDAEREQLLATAAEQAGGIGAYRALDSRFHLTLAHASGNRHAIAAVEGARAELFMWADALLDRPWEEMLPFVRRSAADHLAIARAVAAGHRHKAATLMAQHLERGSANFEEFIAAAEFRRRRSAGA